MIGRWCCILVIVNTVSSALENYFARRTFTHNTCYARRTFTHAYMLFTAKTGSRLWRSAAIPPFRGVRPQKGGVVNLTTVLSGGCSQIDYVTYFRGVAWKLGRKLVFVVTAAVAAGQPSPLGSRRRWAAVATDPPFRLSFNQKA